MTDDMGLESAYPNVGSMLLLMRYANSEDKSWNSNISEQASRIDNGHMPVFADVPEYDSLTGMIPDTNGFDDDGDGSIDEVGNLAQFSSFNSQPMDNSEQLSIPWGMLVYDYFTALPFENTFDSMAGPQEFAAPRPPTDNLGALDGDGTDDDGDRVFGPFDKNYDGYVKYLRSNQPTVELNGLRVRGRININSAPWKIIEGIPLIPLRVAPIYKDLSSADQSVMNQWRWASDSHLGALPMGVDAYTLPPTAENPQSVYEVLGIAKAMGIVAYRELREIKVDSDGDTIIDYNTGNYNVLIDRSIIEAATADPFLRRLRSDGSGNLANTTQRHTSGFLTVGELANVRNPGSFAGTYQYDIGGAYQMDNGAIFNSTPVNNYLFAIAPMVALNDSWLTVKGHTFTMYGVLRGNGDKDSVDEKAIRFQLGIDRSNMLYSKDPNERPTVLYRVVEPYANPQPN